MTSKRAFIAGGGSGIGAATARLFASEGAAVVVADFAEDRAQTVANEITHEGGRAVAVRVDIRREADVAESVKTAVSELGGLDTVVNAAGVWKAVPLWEMEEAEWDRVIGICLKGPYLVCKHVIPHLQRNGGGSIINIGSIGSFVASIAAPHYGAAKGGIRILSKSLALALAKDNIRVNTVNPGPTETSLYDDTVGLDSIRQRITPSIPMGRMGRPEEIATAVLYAASDEASFMTGADIVVDGGYLSI